MWYSLIVVFDEVHMRWNGEGLPMHQGVKDLQLLLSGRFFLELKMVKPVQYHRYDGIVGDSTK